MPRKGKLSPINDDVT